jgi:RNA polymerase sigma-70 factor (ECF subfamily)
MTAGLTSPELEEVHRRFGHLLLRRCTLLLRDPALAEDALQDAFIKIFRYGGDFRNSKSPLRWLYRCVDRSCFDSMQRRKSRLESDAPIPDIPVAPGAARVDERDAVLRFLHMLEESERTIAVLAFVDGLSQGEIADETGYSRQTINKKLGVIRARASLVLGAVHG